MKKPALSPLWLFTVLFLAAMFLPRLVTQGMFGDGLLYSSLARNLAEGRGSFWAPFFSSGYWIEFASGNPYFENPPLMIWLQAGFFWLFGDHWWVEKLYSFLLFILNAWLLVRVWEIPLRDTIFQGKYSWVPLLFWYFIPVVIWGNPNNLMDNNLLTFCLLSLWLALGGLFSGKRIWLKMTLAGVCVYLGFMTKGPVALYPVAAPFLFAIASILPTTVNRQKSIFQGILQSAWIGFVAVSLFAVMLAAIPESQVYFENYWEKRLGVVISGTREDAELTGWARLSIFQILTHELIGVAVVSLVLFFIARKKQIPRVNLNQQKITLLFLLLGLAGTLPLIFSARQSGMYIIPSLPIFALAAGYFHLPLLHHWLAEPSEKSKRFLKKLGIVALAGMAVLAVHLFFICGKPGRETNLLNDLPYIQQTILQGEKVAVCEYLMNSLHTHTYLQRFHHLELTQEFPICRYALTDRRCDIAMNPILEQNGFEKIGGGSAFFVYRKK
jgi:4-amino-4-deoxy-L-arabinose transferase-like glycosyltransferase